MGQPVVLGITMLEVQVPLPALFLTEVGQGVGTVLGVAELEIVAKTRTGAAAVGRAGGESKGLAARCQQEDASTQRSTCTVWGILESQVSGQLC